MNVKKSKVVVFERVEAQVIDFTTPYKVRIATGTDCEIVWGGGKWK